MITGTYIPIITLTINGLNAPIKKHRLAEWIQNNTHICVHLQETYFRTRDIYRLKMRGWKKTFHANGNQNKAGVVMPLDKTDFTIIVEGDSNIPFTPIDR